MRQYCDMPYLVIIRHGQSEYNRQNRFTGQLDVSLTVFGKKEARVAGRKLRKAHLKFDNIFTSGLKRAHQTLEIIEEELGLPPSQTLVIRSDALNERNYGELQGLNKSETAAKFSEKQFTRGDEVIHPVHQAVKVLRILMRV